MRRGRLAISVALGAMIGMVFVAEIGLGRSERATRSVADTVVVGTSLPLTGPLAQFAVLRLGYQQAVDEINAKGGLRVGGAKLKVKLVVLDNKSDPNTASSQARTLFLQENAVALLGAATPPLTIPLSTVADQFKRPLVTSITPVRAWLAGRPSGWKYAWDFFLDELTMTNRDFQTANLINTNKKVALFTDTEPDGVVMGGLWEKKAPGFGYKIVYRAKFPVGTTNYSAFVEAAQKAGAEIVITQMIPPDGIALWKQMKSVGYQPKYASCEKCADSISWPQALGEVAEGTTAVDWWSPSLGYPRSQEFVNRYLKKIGGRGPDLSTIVAGFTVAQVLFDAIERAGSTDPAKINTAIGKTNKLYPFGHIKFEKDHHDGVDVVMAQWQQGQQGWNMEVVYPRSKATAKLEAPVPGLG